MDRRCRKEDRLTLALFWSHWIPSCRVYIKWRAPSGMWSAVRQSNWFLSWSAQPGMRALPRGTPATSLSSAEGKRMQINFPFFLPGSICFNYANPLPHSAFAHRPYRFRCGLLLCLFWTKFRRGEGLQAIRAVTQAERASLTLPPVGSSDTSPAWSVCANSRTQTQAAQPSVSAVSVWFREWKINRWYYASSVLKLIDLSLFGGAFFQVTVAIWSKNSTIKMTGPFSDSLLMWQWFTES